MRLTYLDGCYICICSYNDREIPKMAGFRWNDPVPKAWATKSERVAMALARYADDTCRDRLQAQHMASKDSVEQSWSASSAFNPPAPPGLEYLPFQRAGIEYAVKKLDPHQATRG